MAVTECSSCRRSFRAARPALRREWQASGLAVCPPCYRKFMAPVTPVPTPKPLCPACGAATKVHGEACPKCQEAGGVPLTLFDD